MIKIGFLLPEETMIGYAEHIIEEEHVESAVCKTITTADAVNEARAAAEAGARIIVARGFQAMTIKEYTDIPVVEIKLSAQEIGLLVRQATRLSGKEHPYIHMIAFENMVPDLSHIGELFDVRFETTMMKGLTGLGDLFQELEQDRPDVVIGGQITCDMASQLGYLTLFYHSTEESIYNAVKEAKNITFAMEAQEKDNAQLETMLNMSFNGVIHVDIEGNVILINQLVEDVTGFSRKKAEGKPVTEVLPQLDMTFVDQVLTGKRESLFTSIKIKKDIYMMMIAPIELDNIINGAILSFRLAGKPSQTSVGAGSDSILSGYTTGITFADFPSDNPAMKNVLERAKLFSLSDAPILMYEGVGTEANYLARAIHNNSMRKTNPFVSIDVRDIDEEYQVEELFRRPKTVKEGNVSQGALLKANHGTIFINSIEHLSIRAQHQILRLLMPRGYMHTDAGSIDALNIRMIVCAKKNLPEQIQKGLFLEELYYKLSGLTLDIIPLNRRPEDLHRIFEENVRNYSKKYHRNLRINQGVYKVLEELDWQGNQMQLEAFCEGLVLLSTKRQIDEVVVRKVFYEMYPQTLNMGRQEKVVVYDSPQAVKIRGLLEKHHGNRGKVAEEMGISTTTLWRYMKKYNVEAKYPTEPGEQS